MGKLGPRTSASLDGNVRLEPIRTLAWPGGAHLEPRVLEAAAPPLGAAAGERG